MTANEEYDRATKYGFSMEKQEYFDRYDKKAAYVYSKAQIAPGVNELGHRLVELGFKIGLVSSSRRVWINFVLPRLNFSKNIVYIISINDRKDLKPKPNPDAYLEAIRELGALPETTIILEESNSGIKAAKAAGAYTIGFKQYLVPNYKQTKEADKYADTMHAVTAIVEKLTVPK